MSLIFRIALRFGLAGTKGGFSRFISGLSIFGLASAVSLLILVMSVMNGFDAELRTKILQAVPHIQIFQSDDIEHWQSLAEDIAAIPNVTSVSPFSEYSILIRANKTTEAAGLYTVDASTEAAGSEMAALIGTDTFHHFLQQSNALALGIGLAETLKVTEGDSVTLIIFSDNNAPLTGRFKVTSLINTGTQIDQRLALTGLNNFSLVTGGSALPRGLRIQIQDLFAAHSMANQVLNRLPYGFSGRTWVSSQGNLYQSIQTSRYLVGLMILMMLAIASFNIVSTLMIASADKQADMAVLKTLGASRKTLIWIFAVKGFLIGGCGTLLGTIIGLLLAYSITDVISFLERIFEISVLNTTIYPLDYIPSQVTLWQVAVISGVALMLSLLAAIYPAISVSKVDPANTLRYE